MVGPVGGFGLVKWDLDYFSCWQSAPNRSNSRYVHYISASDVIEQQSKAQRSYKKRYFSTSRSALAAKRVLVVAEHDNQALNVATRHSIEAASKLKGEGIDVIVLGNGANLKKVAEEASGLSGVSKVVMK